jgi:hypothetical protein
VIEQPHRKGPINTTTLAKVDEEPSISSDVRKPLKNWSVILIPPIAWLIGHAGSLFVTGITVSPLVVTGTIGGFISIIIVTWLAASVTNTMKMVRHEQLGRLAMYFAFAGFVAGFVGLLLWLIGCAENVNSLMQRLIGCRDTTKLAWKLIVGFSSLIALAGACTASFIELGSTRFRNWARKVY